MTRNAARPMSRIGLRCWKKTLLRFTVRRVMRNVTCPRLLVHFLC